MLKYQKQQNCLKNFSSQLGQQFDLFAQLPQFRILKQQRFSTKAGRILSLLLFLLWAYYIISEILSLTNRSNPRVVFSEYQPLKTSPQVLSKNNFTLAITITDEKLDSLTTKDKYFMLFAQNCLRSRNLTENGTVTVHQNCTQIPLEICQMEKHFISPYQIDYFQKFNLSHMYCPQSEFWDQNQIEIQGFSQEDYFQFLTIYLMTCQNTSTYQGCSPQEEISQNFKSGFYVIYMGDSLLKMSSSGQPYENSISVQYSLFSYSNSKQIHSTIKVTETTSDYGIIFTNNAEDVSLSQSNIKEETSSYNQQYLIANSIFLDQRRNQYLRTYPKLYAILGQIGGLWQFVNLILYVLLYPIFLVQMNLAMANKIFQFENQEIPENQDVISVARSIPMFSYRENNDSLRSFAQQIPASLVEYERTKIHIKQFLRRKKCTLIFGFFDSIKLLFGCYKQRERQLQYAMKKIQSKLDICQLIGKISEIDKLKNILLNKDQLALFNYIPKPKIPLDMFSENFDKKIKLLEQRNEYKFILENEKPDVLKLDDAYEAYTRLQQKNELSWIDQSILSSIDDDIKKLFSGIYEYHADFICQNIQVSQTIQKINTEKMEIQDEPHIQLVAGSVMSRQM